MNRADQAPDPSMEELLASIRLIISDADRKNSTVPGESGFPRHAASMNLPDESDEGDEVLDLTDDLVLAGQAAPESALPAEVPPSPEPEPRQQHAFQKDVLRDASAFPTQSTPAPAAKHPDSAGINRKDASEASSSVKPVWSRREMPFRGASFEPPAPRSRAEPQPPKPPARAWPGDVQMAVPSQGPVSLVPGGEQEEPSSSRTNEPPSQEGTNSALESDEGAAVAALAQKLARSAAGAMAPEELETAQQVDFEHIDETSKAEVTERFADAIARESATISKPALPDLLNEVFRQDFRRDAPTEGDSPPGGEPPMSGQPPAQEWDAVFEERAPQASAKSAPVYRERPSVSQPQAQNLERTSLPSAVAVPAASQALVPAQPGLPAQPIRSLEDAVREMLRPLLVQWLNENMPRILENAIREEIAARGIFPNKDT